MRGIVMMVGLAALASCTETTAPTTKAPAPAAAQSPAVSTVQAAGAPVDCLDIRSIGESRVVDDSDIDFYIGAGGQVYRNHLPYACPSLGFDKAFSYATSLSQLCSTDTITVIHAGGPSPQRGATCGLGKFQPIAGAPR